MLRLAMAALYLKIFAANITLSLLMPSEIFRCQYLRKRLVTLAAFHQLCLVVKL